MTQGVQEWITAFYSRIQSFYPSLIDRQMIASNQSLLQQYYIFVCAFLYVGTNMNIFPVYVSESGLAWPKDEHIYSSHSLPNQPSEHFTSLHSFRQPLSACFPTSSSALDFCQSDARKNILKNQVLPYYWSWTFFQMFICHEHSLFCELLICSLCPLFSRILNVLIN